MNIVRKQIEGPTRRIPFSKTKIKTLAELNYQIGRKKLEIGRKIDRELSEQRRSIIGIEDKQISQEQLNKKTEEAKQKWEFIKQNRQKIREG